MLTIRPAQINEFTKREAVRLEQRLLNHVRRFFAFQSEYLGDEGVLAVIRPAIERAHALGLGTERELGYYVTLVFLLGSDFENDPQYGWVAARLCACTEERPLIRAKETYEAVSAWLDTITGPGDDHYKRALLRLRGFNPLSIAQLPAGEESPLLGRLLPELYPEKCERLGLEVMAAVVSRACASAQELGLPGTRGAVLVGVTGFMLGSGFAADPQFPWASAVLSNRAIREQEGREQALADAARAYLEDALAFTAE